MLIKETDYKPVKGFEIAKTYLGKALWTTHFYLVGKTLIDNAAPNAAASLSAIVDRYKPEVALVTHHHEDHSGNTGLLAEGRRVPVFGSPLTVEALAKPLYQAPFQRIVWGRQAPAQIGELKEPLTHNGYTFEPIAAPGHSHDMTVFWEPNHGWLFSGDLFLASNIKYFREDEDFAQTKASLEKVVNLDFEALFCGHNPKPKNGKRLLRRKLEYMLELEGKALLLRQKGMAVAEITHALLGREGLFPFLSSGRMAKRNLIDSILESAGETSTRGSHE